MGDIASYMQACKGTPYITVTKFTCVSITITTLNVLNLKIKLSLCSLFTGTFLCSDGGNKHIQFASWQFSIVLLESQVKLRFTMKFLFTSKLNTKCDCLVLLRITCVQRRLSWIRWWHFL